MNKLFTKSDGERVIKYRKAYIVHRLVLCLQYLYPQAVMRIQQHSINSNAMIVYRQTFTLQIMNPSRPALVMSVH
jgi:hypothetical protein